MCCVFKTTILKIYGKLYIFTIVLLLISEKMVRWKNFPTLFLEVYQSKREKNKDKKKQKNLKHILCCLISILRRYQFPNDPWILKWIETRQKWMEYLNIVFFVSVSRLCFRSANKLARLERFANSIKVINVSQPLFSSSILICKQHKWLSKVVGLRVRRICTTKLIFYMRLRLKLSR